MEAMQGLFIFGYNDKHEIDATQHLDTYLTLRSTLLKLNQYISIPGIIANKEKLRPYAENPIIIKRIEETLLALDCYHHPEDQYSSQDPEW